MNRIAAIVLAALAIGMPVAHADPMNCQTDNEGVATICTRDDGSHIVGQMADVCVDTRSNEVVPHP